MMKRKWLWLPTAAVALTMAACGSKTTTTKTTTEGADKTKLYQIYVADYLETKSIDRSRKKKIIIYIYILMGVSIYFAPIIFVKIGLALLTVFITYYLFKVIPDK